MGRKRIDCPLKNCKQCGEPLTRKMYGEQLESRPGFARRKYCNLICSGLASAKKTVGLAALRWRTRAIHGLAKACLKCGGDRLLGIHHLDENPENNAPENVTTLCASCHTRWHWRHGKKPWSTSPPCSVCGETSRLRGMCQRHAARFRKYGDPLLTKRRGAGGRFCLVRLSPSD